MKKAILISIKPEWVEKILNGEKTIEIRKSMPKCDLPIDVYIYVAKSKPFLMVGRNDNKSYSDDGGVESVYSPNHNYIGNGKVVAKFTLNKLDEIAYERLDNGVGYHHFFYCEDDFDLLKNSCLDEFNLLNYLNPKKTKGNICGYAWHIDNLQIFDNPMELSEFYTHCNQAKNVKEHKGSVYINDIYKPLNYSSNPACRKCKYYDDDFNLCKQPNNVNKAPQSWQYVYVVD